MEDEDSLRWLHGIIARTMRACIIGLMYMIAFRCAGADYLKSVVVGFITASLTISGIGGGWIDRIGALAFILALMSWAGIVPLDRVAHAAVISLDRLSF
jgi:hypothetical protein